MKATVMPAALAAACKLTSAAIGSKPRMPVLAGAHLVPTEAGVSVSTFDMETSVRTVLRTETPPSGDPVLVSHRLLAQVAAVAGTKPLTLDVDGRALRATSGRSVWRMPLMHVDDYPTLPVLPDVLGKVDAADLAAAIRDVTLAAGTDESLPMLTGLHVTFAGDELTLAATDRYRLHTATVPWAPETDTDHPAIRVPARSVRTAAAFGHGTAELYADGNLLAIAVDDTRFTTRLLDASFPAYRSLIRPRADSSTFAWVDSAQMTAAIKQVSVGASLTDPLQITITSAGLQIEAKDDEGNVVGTAEVDALVDGDDVRVRLNATFLGDTISTFGEAVELQIANPNKPVSFAARGEDPRSLVMPVRIPSDVG